MRNRYHLIACSIGLICVAALAAAADQSEKNPLEELLAHKIIQPELVQTQVENFCDKRVRRMPEPMSLKRWQKYEKNLRREILDKVVLRGEAKEWAKGKTKVEWLDTIDAGEGYSIRKLRYEALPGLWIPALLYEPDNLERDKSVINSGSVMIGQNASILAGSHSQNARIVPEAAIKDIPKPPEAAYRCKGRTHFDNWTLAIKGEDKIMSPFEYAGPLSEIIVLGDIALMHPGKRLLWDSENMRITNDKAANESLFMRRIDPRDDMNWC